MSKDVRDLLGLPRQGSRGDFVLNLPMGVAGANAVASLRDYSVAAQLAGCLAQGAKSVGAGVQGAGAWKAAVPREEDRCNLRSRRLQAGDQVNDGEPL